MITRVLLFVTSLATTAAAQWINYPTPGTPRTRDGKPNLSAPAPMTRDGKPDLSGIWESIPPQTGTRDADPFTSLQDLNFFDLQNFLPPGASARCLPHGIPDAMLIPADFKIVQNPGLTLILYEEFNHYRQIFTDGRPHPKDRNPAWFGYSIGKWNRDAFVVDTVGFNDQSWLDDHGHPHTDALHTTERFRRRDFGHMELQVTIDDPNAYTAPWTATIQFRLLPDTELIEDVCDNEKDAPHSLGK